MSGYVEKAAVLRIIFDSVGKPATEIYQRVRELPEADLDTKYANLCCELCRVCPEGKRNPYNCEFLTQFEEAREE